MYRINGMGQTYMAFFLSHLHGRADLDEIGSFQLLLFILSKLSSCIFRSQGSPAVSNFGMTHRVEAKCFTLDPYEPTTG